MKRWSNFKKVMIIGSILLTFLTILFFILFKKNGEELFHTLSITFFTTAFHFDIRLLIGNIIPLIKNKINVNAKYFKLRGFEKVLYKKINVKNWKNNVPTYEPDEYNIKKYPLDEIIKNMCNSEIIHTINTFISYIPILFIFYFGNPIVFILTSVVASIFDLQFVIIQRYNRARLIKVLEGKNANKIYT